MTGARFTFFVTTLSLCVARDSASQDTTPMHNPIVSSITGTNAEPDIFREVNLSSFELLTGSVQWKDVDQTTKLIFTPLKLRDTYAYIPVLSELAFNLAQAKGVTTFGVGLAYNSKSLTSRSAQEALQRVLSSQKSFRSQKVGESDAEYDLLRSAFLKKQWFEIYDDFYTSLARHAIIVSAALNGQTFGILGGDDVDVDQDGVIDNHYNSKGHDLSATITYTLSQKTGVTLSVHRSKRRQSSKEDAELATYPGWSIAVGQRVLNLNPRYRETENYLKSLFIPAIIAGVSLEAQRCSGSAASCEEGMRSRRALTPFVDVKVSPEAQFRIGVPIRKTVAFGGVSKTELAASAQYIIQLKGLK
jgi:hypothetical protein